MLKIYLASSYERKDELCKYADEMHTRGLECTSTWLTRNHDDPLITYKYAIWNLNDIDRSHFLVAFTQEQPFLRGGMHTEVGYAMALDMRRVFVHGPKTNIFHHLLSEHRVYTEWNLLLNRLCLLDWLWSFLPYGLPTLRTDMRNSLYDNYLSIYSGSLDIGTESFV